MELPLYKQETYWLKCETQVTTEMAHPEQDLTKGDGWESSLYTISVEYLRKHSRTNKIWNRFVDQHKVTLLHAFSSFFFFLMQKHPIINQSSIIRGSLQLRNDVINQPVTDDRSHTSQLHFQSGIASSAPCYTLMWTQKQPHGPLFNSKGNMGHQLVPKPPVHTNFLQLYYPLDHNRATK